MLPSQQAGLCGGRPCTRRAGVSSRRSPDYLLPLLNRRSGLDGAWIVPGKIEHAIVEACIQRVEKLQNRLRLAINRGRPTERYCLIPPRLARSNRAHHRRRNSDLIGNRVVCGRGQQIHNSLKRAGRHLRHRVLEPGFVSRAGPASRDPVPHVVGMCPPAEVRGVAARRPIARMQREEFWVIFSCPNYQSDTVSLGPSPT